MIGGCDVSDGGVEKDSVDLSELFLPSFTSFFFYISSSE